MKLIPNILIAILSIFFFSACNSESEKLPILTYVDFSKKGTIYETDFTVPFNIWGSNVAFTLFPDGKDYSKEYTKEQEDIFYKMRYLKPIKETPYFKVKITLKPLFKSYSDTEIIVGKNGKFETKVYKRNETIEEIVSLPLYGRHLINSRGSDKALIIADLQRFRSYHVKIEVLEDAKIPEFVKTKFGIESKSRKH
ncbi:hypothetical protein [Halarcobacter sp.]|uniref:hypothetical protein n=1 Tax=Halarcobacter sp. TaxID=2321133 RepID=UPI003B002950